MKYKKEKMTINVLANIDSYFGEHQGRLGPVILFLCISAAPLLLYIMLFIGIIPFKFILIFEVPFVIRMALRILGKEEEKLKIYINSREDVYATADDLLRISHIQEDGLIEYMNGKIAYIVSAFTSTYFNDDELSIDLEAFIELFGKYEYDIYCHLVVDEFRLQDRLELMNVYEDKEMLQERINFYMLQDKYCSEHSKLYRINFLVKASKYDWKQLRSTLDSAVKSAAVNVFKQCYICDKLQAQDVMSRDLCLFIDIADMMKKKYKNENYYGSKVLYYGEDVPEELRVKQDIVDLNERRVIQEPKKEEQ